MPSIGLFCRVERKLEKSSSGDLISENGHQPAVAVTVARNALSGRSM